MTLDDVRARRAELYEIAARHGVDRLSVVVAGPDVWLPYEAEVYIEVRFTSEAKQQPGGLWYFTALEDLRHAPGLQRGGWRHGGRVRSAGVRTAPAGAGRRAVTDDVWERIREDARSELGLV